MGIKKRVAVYGVTTETQTDLLIELNKSEFFKFQSPGSISHFKFLDSYIPPIYTAEYQVLLLDLDSATLTKTPTELKSLFLHCNFDRRLIIACYGEDSEKNKAVIVALQLSLKEDQQVVYSPTLLALSLQICNSLIVQSEIKEHCSRLL